MHPKSPLNLFDFDNTLSLCDSFVPYTLYQGGPRRFLRGALSLARRRLSGKIGRTEAKELMLQGTLVGAEKFDVEAYAALFLKTAMNSEVLGKLESYLSRGERVIIVSAGPELYLKAIADSLGVELIGTRLELNPPGTKLVGQLSGKVLGENCRGAEKIKRLSEVLNLEDFSPIRAFGDSDGDKELLERADEKFYRYGRGKGYFWRKILGSIKLYWSCFWNCSKT